MFGLRRVLILFVGIVLAMALWPVADHGLSYLAILGSLLFWMGDERRQGPTRKQRRAKNEAARVVEVHHHHYGPAETGQSATPVDRSAPNWGE